MNLIICYTPLQVLLAEKIIEKYPNDKFFGVMIYTVKNAKFEFYSKRLSQQCEEFFSLHQHIDRFNLLKEILQIKYQFKGKQFDNVFVASINDIQIQFLLSNIKFKTFYTFDDGTANIVPSSVYYTKEPNTLIRKLLNKILNNKYSTQKLKDISTTHFTLYNNLPNIIKNTEYINLFKLNNYQQNNNEEMTNILLGQPIYLDPKQNIKLVEDTIKRFDIQYYFPHPREQYKIPNINYIETPLIFEDYIAQHFPNKKCRVYSYFSSAILNLKDSHIEIIALKVETDKPAFIESYQLLEKANIPIIDIRN